jgi:hypothetical protein
MTVTEQCTFTCRSPSLRGTFRVHTIDGENVVFSRATDFLDVWQLPLKSLLKRQSEGYLTVITTEETTK